MAQSLTTVRLHALIMFYTLGSKRLADLITWSRLASGGILAWLGVVAGPRGLPWAAWLLLLSWTGDSVDGPLARRQPHSPRTWIGEHDLEVDMLVAAGLFIYMTASGYVPGLVAGAYFAVWLAVFRYFGLQRPLEMLFQGPVYGWFIYIALGDSSRVGWWLVGWIGMAILFTWPKAVHEIVPGFLRGMANLERK